MMPSLKQPAGDLNAESRAYSNSVTSQTVTRELRNKLEGKPQKKKFLGLNGPAI